MDKQSVLNKVNVLRMNPVLLVILALVFEILAETLVRALAEFGVITSTTLFFTLLYGVQFLSKATFFVIILYYRQFEKRYVFYSVFSIIALLSYSFLFYNYVTRSPGSFANDLNVIFSIASFGMAVYIAVDPTVRTFVKPIIVGSSVMILLFRSFLTLMWFDIVIKTFAIEVSGWFNVGTVLFIFVYHGAFLIWLFPQIYLMKKIDYM